MDQQLPEPLNTPDCDIRGYQFMGWYGDIYYASNAYKLGLKNPGGALAAQKLYWWAFAHQCPAGSLPSDDDDLARIADFGTDLRAWRKVKETALHGFILCSDGRLYHKFVVERAKHEPASRENAWGEVGAYEGGSERLSGIWSGFEHGGSPFSSRRRPSDHPTGFTAHKPAAAAHARRHGHARPAPRYAA